VLARIESCDGLSTRRKRFWLASAIVPKTGLWKLIGRPLSTSQVAAQGGAAPVIVVAHVPGKGRALPSTDAGRVGGVVEDDERIEGDRSVGVVDGVRG